jgi:hypothetical protein
MSISSSLRTVKLSHTEPPNDYQIVDQYRRCIDCSFFMTQSSVNSTNKMWKRSSLSLSINKRKKKCRIDEIRLLKKRSGFFLLFFSRVNRKNNNDDISTFILR